MIRKLCSLRHRNYEKNSSSLKKAVLCVVAFSLFTISGCSFYGFTKFPKNAEGCKMRAYVNAGLVDYLSARYKTTNMSRLAIVPFNVPESFAPSGNQTRHFGRDIAMSFHQEIVGSGELGIVELFNRDRWPGKRAEFSNGNYYAIESARNAGYDLVLVGYLEDIVNETDLTLLTKLIDTSNGVTLWYGRTVTYSTQRPLRRSLSEYSFGFVRDRPDSFAFQERVAEMARCTVDNILYGDALEAGQNQPKESWARRLLPSSW